MRSNKMFTVTSGSNEQGVEEGECLQTTSTDLNMLWHQRYGHLSFKGLKIQEDKKMSVALRQQVQRKLQLRIEAQGEQLKMMIDQQRKTTSSLLETRNPNNLSPSNNHMSPVPEVQIPEVSDNSEFPSKIS
ncbi:hypothetical protein LIER_35323 [Lithospermum erythrorhizon]|uniref:Uncharacterized protein n=1 Tax=Lithospermum erythrorhizon TaxID=34254 RepID=A0AAV3NQF7_LITER